MRAIQVQAMRSTESGLPPTLGFPPKSQFPTLTMTDAQQQFSKAEDEIILDVCDANVYTESAKISFTAVELL